MDLPEGIVCLRMIFSGGIKVKVYCFCSGMWAEKIASKLILLLIHYDVDFYLSIATFDSLWIKQACAGAGAGLGLFFGLYRETRC